MEHWSLLATRGTMWSEAMIGSTIHLTVALASLVVAMNRLRAAYDDLAPEVAPYLVTSTLGGQAGLMQTDTMGGPAACSLVTYAVAASVVVRARPDLTPVRSELGVPQWANIPRTPSSVCW